MGKYLKIAKEKAETYYKLEMIESDLKTALEATRNEPGLAIKDTARVISKVFKGDSMALVKELRKLWQK